MSQDKFWDQSGSEQKTGENKPSGGGEGQPVAGLDADVLAAWLQELPEQDAIIPKAKAPAPPAADAPWPPAAPVDPFVGIQKSAGGGTLATDWDLSFDDLTPAAPAPPAPARPAEGAHAAPSSLGPPPPPAAPPAEALKAPPLRVEVTCGKRTIEQVIQGEALIGRPDATRGIHPEIDLRLDDAVSRRHAKIFVRDGLYVLTDLNSTNGTRHNRQWLQAEAEAVLKSGDEIEVGERTLIRVLEAPNA